MDNFDFIYKYFYLNLLEQTNNCHPAYFGPKKQIILNPGKIAHHVHYSYHQDFLAGSRHIFRSS